MIDLSKSESESMEAYLDRLHQTGVASNEDLELWRNGSEANLHAETRNLVVQVSPKTRSIPTIRFRDGEEVVEDETHYFSITELAYSLSSIKINIPSIGSKSSSQIWINHEFAPVPESKIEIEFRRYIHSLIEMSTQLLNEPCLLYTSDAADE